MTIQEIENFLQKIGQPYETLPGCTIAMRYKKFYMLIFLDDEDPDYVEIYSLTDYHYDEGVTKAMIYEAAARINNALPHIKCEVSEIDDSYCMLRGRAGSYMNTELFERYFGQMIVDLSAFPELLGEYLSEMLDNKV